MDSILKQQIKSLKFLNDNIIKLANVISLATRRRPINDLPPGHTAEVINFPYEEPQSPIISSSRQSSKTKGESSDQQKSQTNSQLERNRIERESIDSGGKYLPGAGDYLSEAKNKYTSIEGFFDLEKSSGLLANLLKKKVASNQYVKDQMALNPGKKDLPGYEKSLRDQFNKQQKIQKQQQQVSTSISGLRSRGYTDDQIKRSGLFDKQRDLDNEMALVNPSYKERRTTERIANLKLARESKKQDTDVKAVATSNNDEESQKSNSDLITTEEERENLVLMKEQNTSLKAIETNTAALPEVVAFIDNLAKSIDKLSSQAQPAPQAPQESSGVGGFLRGAASLGGNVLKSGGRAIASLGGARAVLGAAGLATAGWLAGSAVEAGSEKLKESGYEQTGKAVGVGGSALKYAGVGAAVGSLVPGVGTLVGAAIGGTVGAGVGIYDQYFGEEADKADLLSKDAEGQLSLNNGKDLIRYSSKDGKYLINDNPVDKETYEKFIAGVEGFQNPESRPEYQPIYEKAVEIVTKSKPEQVVNSDVGQEMIQTEAGMEAKNQVREIAQGEIVNIVSSLKPPAKVTPESQPRMTSKSKGNSKQQTVRHALRGASAQQAPGQQVVNNTQQISENLQQTSISNDSTNNQSTMVGGDTVLDQSAAINNINQREVVTPIQNNIVNRSNPNTNLTSNTTNGSVTKNITELNYEQMAAPAGSDFTLANNVVAFPGNQQRAIDQSNVLPVEPTELGQLPVPNQVESVIKPMPAASDKITPIKSTGGGYGEAVYKRSANNAIAGAIANSNKQQVPVVVNAPSTNVNNNSTIATGPRFARNTESSIQQYNKSRFF